MKLLDYLRACRRRWPLIAIAVSLAALTAGLVTSFLPPRFDSSVTLLVSASGRQRPKDATAAYQSHMLSQQRAKSYVSLVRGEHLPRAIAGALGGDATPRSVRERITARVAPGTVLLRITATDASPYRAQRLAEVAGVEFVRYVNEVDAPSPRGSAGTVRVIDGPTGPREPVSPRPLLYLAFALLGGLLVGSAAAVLRDRTDTSIRSPHRLRAATGKPTLAVLEREPARAKRRATPAATRSSVRVERFRSLRLRLCLALRHTCLPARADAADTADAGPASADHPAGADPAEVTAVIDAVPASAVAITSPAEGDGKTTTACDLAVALANAGHRVILVEADTRSPRICRYLGIDVGPGTPGLTHVLRGELDVNAALRHWSDEISVLPVGPIGPDTGDLFCSAETGRVLRALRTMADIVIVDTPPLLHPVGDAAPLARACDTTVLVARYGKTRIEDAARAVERLSSVDAPLLGAVLNAAPPQNPRRHGKDLRGHERELRALTSGGGTSAETARGIRVSVR